MKPIERFKELYTSNLTKAVLKYPDRYYITLEDVPSVVDKVVGLIESQGVAHVDIHGYAFRWTAKETGIKNTYTAWKTYFSQEKP